MVVRCGDEVSTVGAGYCVSMPHGVPHTFVVIGDRDAHILLVHDNTSFRDLIRELGTPAGAHVVPAEPVFPAIEELVRVGSAHDLRAIGPPMNFEDVDAVLASLAPSA